MKQYMILKIASESLGKVMNLTPIVGLSSREDCEQAVLTLKHEDPQAMYLIQEVGMA